MSDAMTDRSSTIHGDYPLPRHNVVLLSCMDLRLADELAAFMDRDNLTNRYDHLITAGAALGVMRHDDLDRSELHFGPLAKGHDCTHCPPWRTTFFDHLEVALKLHKPHGVYIVEHRNCGAYKAFLGKDDYPDPPPADGDEEYDDHKEWAFKLKKAIEEWYAGWYDEWWRRWLADHPGCKVPAEKDRDHPQKLDVLCFLMDLRGDIDCLTPITPAKPRAVKATRGKGKK
jgi:hypothetical protein